MTTVSLDDYVTAWAAVPTVIKIDVEGHESAVLTGALQTLERYRPTLLCEVHGAEEAEAVVRSVAGVGYEQSQLPDVGLQRVGRAWRNSGANTIPFREIT